MYMKLVGGMQCFGVKNSCFLVEVVELKSVSYTPTGDNGE